ncbi:unnamed protein product [Parnassius mnemosyne]|uniref:Gustatory receptor n=1 Tax=Parnassius mnemosyne TaxID=213953 RepID=A0AAV1LY33_9NEOP
MQQVRKLTNHRICDFHYCLREPMRLCRLAGLFPVDGLTNSSVFSLRFSLKFPYILFHAASVIGITITTGFSVIWFFLSPFSLNTLSIALFYVTGLLSTVLLIHLAMNWSKLIRRVLEIEVNLVEIRRAKTAFWKYNTITYMIMFLALLEHAMSIISKITSVMSDLNESRVTYNVLDKYFLSWAPFIFDVTSYSLWKSILFKIANTQATFAWNITDVMTMCVSIYLTSYFQDLNEIINNQYKSMSWEKLRILYSQLVALVKEIDSRFCYLILLSFFTNLFFICLQLFNTLNSIHSTVYLLYYLYSFVFLITRATVTCLLAANVNKAAQEPMFVVGYVPASDYTLEVQRFNRQIRYTTTALSGVYFYVTRSTLLYVVGTIITYELVLLQFNLETADDADLNNNGTLYKYMKMTV